jgi:hypothetical protein
MPASEGPLTHALDRTASGIGLMLFILKKKAIFEGAHLLHNI